MTDLAFSPDGRSLASADDSGLVRVWDAQTGKPRVELSSENGPAVAFSPDGKALATAGAFGGMSPRVRLWDVATGEERP